MFQTARKEVPIRGYVRLLNARVIRFVIVCVQHSRPAFTYSSHALMHALGPAFTYSSHALISGTHSGMHSHIRSMHSCKHSIVIKGTFSY